MKHSKPAYSAVALATMAALVACGGDDTDAQAEIDEDNLQGTLSFATWHFLEPGRGDEVLEAVTAYSDENPDAEIDPVAIARADYESTISTQLGAGDGPDLFVIPDAFFPELADSGMLEPLDVAIEASGAENMRDAHDEFQVDDEQLSVIWGLTPYGLFWNEDILDEAGVEPPSDIDALIEAAETIEAETGVTGFTVRHQMNEAAPWWTDFSNWPFGFGGSWSDGTNLTINSEENIAALQAFKSVHDSDGFGGGDDASTYRSAFSEGELGMAIDNAGALFTMVDGTVTSDQVGASVLPFPGGGSSFSGMTFGVNPNSENKDLALDFVRWALTEDAQQGFADAIFPSAVATDISPSQELLDDYPWTEPFFDQSEDSSGVVIEGFETQTPEISTIILTEVERVLTQDVDPEEALNSAQEQAEALG